MSNIYDLKNVINNTAQQKQIVLPNLVLRETNMRNGNFS